MEEIVFYTGTPSLEEGRRYIARAKFDKSFMPSSRRSAGERALEDTEISDDDLSDSFKKDLKEALEEKNKQKLMNIKQELNESDHEEGSSDLEFKFDPKVESNLEFDPKIEPESPDEESQCATSEMSFHFGPPTVREIKKFFARPKPSTVDVTVTNLSSDIDTTFEEFLQAKRDHLLRSTNSEKEMNIL